MCATTKEEEDYLLNNVKSNVVQLAMDSNGTHVLQAIIKTFREERLCHFLEEVTETDKTLLQVACNCHGICVIKALIEKIRSQKQSLISHLCKLSFELASDPFGNYAIQNMISS